MGGMMKALVIVILMSIAAMVGGGMFTAGVTMTSPAMEPALPEGCRAFVNYYAPRSRDIKRGEMVLIQVPGEETVLVRRAIAFKGETVEMNNSEILINGQKLAEPWLHAPNTEPKIENPQPDYFPATIVPEDSVFVLADIRKGPRDSRSFGAVKHDRILGVVWTLFGMTF